MGGRRGVPLAGRPAPAVSPLAEAGGLVRAGTARRRGAPRPLACARSGSRTTSATRSRCGWGARRRRALRGRPAVARAALGDARPAPRRRRARRELLRRAAPGRGWDERGRRGWLLVEDHSHDPFSPWATSSSADYAFSSLRKTLPVPDGAILWSPRGSPSAASRAGRADGSELKLAAMLLKGRYLGQRRRRSRSGSAGSSSTARSGWREAPIAGASAATRESRVGGAPLPWRARRSENTVHLLGLIAGLEVAEPLFNEWPADAAPLGVVLVFESADGATRSRAAARGGRLLPGALADRGSRRPSACGSSPRGSSRSRPTGGTRRPTWRASPRSSARPSRSVTVEALGADDRRWDELVDASPAPDVYFRPRLLPRVRGGRARARRRGRHGGALFPLLLRALPFGEEGLDAATPYGYGGLLPPRHWGQTPSPMCANFATGVQRRVS